MALSIGFRVSVSLHPAIQATERLALAPAGLAPPNRICLSLDTRSPHPPAPAATTGSSNRGHGLRALLDDPMVVADLTGHNPNVFLRASDPPRRPKAAGADDCGGRNDSLRCGAPSHHQDQLP